MKTSMRAVIVSGAVLAFSLCAADRLFANGGPFVVKYPGGDPAAKGILARLDPNLKPAREERLRVIKEDLKIIFDPIIGGNLSPLAHVTAVYTIENPTEEEIEVDFGFPILRGIYMNPISMMPKPDVEVRMNGGRTIHTTLISNSVIYGLIRRQARELIEAAVTKDAELAELVATVRATGMVRQRARRAILQTTGDDTALAKVVAEDRVLADVVSDATDVDHAAARAALAEYLSGAMNWNTRDVALMVEFASLDFGGIRTRPRDRGHISYHHLRLSREVLSANLGPLGAIGEQKATQFFAKVASCFDPEAASTYESIFSAWGGDIRERSVDLKTGEVRPREFSLDAYKSANTEGPASPMPPDDPTIYARVEYLDPNATISEAEKASCKTILKNLPVIFTFAPMNLLHYRVKFPANATQTLTVTYKQYAYADTRDPFSYQVAYVLHPASLWKEFGPINLEVVVPEDVPFRASVSCKDPVIEERTIPAVAIRPSPEVRQMRCSVHRATLEDKTGELFLAVDTTAWKRMLGGKTEKPKEQQTARK